MIKKNGPSVWRKSTKNILDWDSSLSEIWYKDENMTFNSISVRHIIACMCTSYFVSLPVVHLLWIYLISSGGMIKVSQRKIYRISQLTIYCMFKIMIYNEWNWLELYSGELSPYTLWLCISYTGFNHVFVYDKIQYQKDLPRLVTIHLFIFNAFENVLTFIELSSLRAIVIKSWFSSCALYLRIRLMCLEIYGEIWEHLCHGNERNE